MVFRLPKEHIFPDPRLAEEDGLLAVGGDLDPDRILCAYKQGIFPWFSKGNPILWWSPDPRLVLFPEKFKISPSFRQTLKNGKFRVSLDTCFREVITKCARTPRKDQDGTWITSGMKKAYIELFEMGFAHSVETWLGDDLVGGLYGIAIKRAFFGESMFFTHRDASKAALSFLVDQAKLNDYHFIDCQLTTSHLLSLGATEISRDDYLELLNNALT
ncbi:MAG: leucyl/phenylalanyl-tRNA--protein transferase [Bacteroidales bacterium]